MTADVERLTKLAMELRRGALTIAVFSALRQPHYGYSLRKLLLHAGLDIDEGTLYPLLRRLEQQGLLNSEWQQHEGRKRRIYQINTQGQQALAHMQREWSALQNTLTLLAE